jgi:hypothetical protein
MSQFYIETEYSIIQTYVSNLVIGKGGLFSDGIFIVVRSSLSINFLKSWENLIVGVLFLHFCKMNIPFDIYPLIL